MTTWTFEGRTVLLVEDDYLIADEVVASLESAGATVLGPVATVGDALELVASGADPDCAVLDVHLRDRLVYPIADKLEERGTPFVFLTGYDAEAIEPKYATVPRIAKPFNLRRVAYALSRLEERRASAANGP